MNERRTEESVCVEISETDTKDGKTTFQSGEEYLIPVREVRVRCGDLEVAKEIGKYKRKLKTIGDQ